jgi:hypothetical protein
MHLQPREEREERDLAAFDVCDRRGDGVGGVDHVGVDEEQQLAARAKTPLMQRPRLAEPPGRRLLAGDDDEPRVLGGEARQDRAGGVGGAIVDDDHLELRIRLRQHPPHRPLDHPLLIPRRHDDRHEREPSRHPRLQPRDEEEVDDHAEEREQPE